MTNMTKLAELRSQLTTLVRRRRAARWVIGGSAVVLAILWSLAAFFVIDWTFSMGRFERAFTLLVAGAAIGAAYWFLARPWLNRREDIVDMALLVEKQRGIDSDLVAALQFQGPAAGRWGSTQLREAVIEYVTDYGKEWNLLRDFPRDQMKRRAIMVAATAVIVFGTMLLLPQHTVALFNRLALGSKHYPSRTQLKAVAIHYPKRLGKTNDPQTINTKNEILQHGFGKDFTQQVLQPLWEDVLQSLWENLLEPLWERAIAWEQFSISDYGEHEIHVRRPFNSSVDFEVIVAGEGPPSGVLRATGVETGAKTSVTLTQDPKIKQVYRGQLPRLVDTLLFSVELGDAWMDPAELAVVPLPAVDLRLVVTPPAYASGRRQKQPERTAQRQLSVLEGSRVDLGVVCENKALQSATLRVGEKSYPLAKVDAEGHKWKLPVAGAPLAEVTAPVRYTLDVVDQDDLSLERPIEGTIGVEVDRPPRAEIQLATRQCWPGAMPNVDLRATDDYALSALAIRATIQRASGATEQRTIPVWHPAQPLLADRLPLERRVALDLKPLKLLPGDHVSLQLEAQDYRGRRQGETTLSPAEALAITDELDAERAVTIQLDPHTEELFNDIIGRLTDFEGKR